MVNVIFLYLKTRDIEELMFELSLVCNVAVWAWKSYKGQSHSKGIHSLYQCFWTSWNAL